MVNREDSTADDAPAPVIPAGRKEPFSRRAVAPAGVTPPARTGSGELAGSPPMAAFAGATPPAPTEPAPTEPAQAEFAQAEAAAVAEQQRLAALAARRAQAAARPSWFLSAPPEAPVSTSPFALVSSRPQPAAPTGASAPPAPSAQEIAAAEATAAAERAQLQAFADQAGAIVVHPDALRGALSAPQSPPTPVIPPIVAAPEPEPVQDATPAPPIEAAPPIEGPAAAPPPTEPAEPTEPADAPVTGRRGRLKRGGKKTAAAGVAEPAPEVTAVTAAAQEAALEAYRRYAREGTMISEDYYRGPAEEIHAEPEPTVVIAESLIPTGKPRLAKQPDKPRGPKIAAALVVLAIAGGGYYWETHQVSSPAITGLPSVTLDQTTAADGVLFTVPAASTSGASYRLTVPPGWKAVSNPTRPGGAHVDVTVTEPILNLTVTVRSESASAPDTVEGKPVDTALRVFGRPAGIVASVEPAGSTTVSRVATVTLHKVRYAVTLTVPRESAVRDYGRADVVARSLTAL